MTRLLVVDHTPSPRLHELLTAADREAAGELGATVALRVCSRT